MTTLTRWKLATALLAAIAAYALFLRGDGPSNAPAATVSASRSATALPDHFRRPIRISPEVAGISKTELVDRMLATRSLKDLTVLAAKLGMIGDDEAIDRVLPLLKDPRRGVPELVLAAIGQIGTEHAVEILVADASDDRRRSATRRSARSAPHAPARRDVAGHARPRPVTPPSRRRSPRAVQIGTTRVVELLVKLCGAGDHTVAIGAVWSLSQISTPEAQQALRKLIDAPDARVAAVAIAAIDDIDEDLLKRLVTIVKSGDPQLVNSALTALGKAGEAALPVLREAALQGGSSTRWAAVHAIGELGGDKATELLGEIMKTGDRQAASAAAGALAGIGGETARDLLIEAALSDRAQQTGALQQLAQMEGEDVEQALLKVVKEGTSADRRAVLPRLIKSGNADALTMAIDLAGKGSRSERHEAMRMLADAGQPKAFDALIDIAGKARGHTRVTALEMLAQSRPGDAALDQLLTDSLFSGRRDESSYAASVLGRIGTEQARQSLITALGGDDKQLAAAAAGALGQVGLTPTVKTALLAAAQNNPQVKMQVMHQLINAGAPEGIRIAEEMLSATGKEAAHAQSAVWALASSGTPDAKRILQRALESKEPSVRMAAISTLGQNPDDQETDTLLRLTRDADASVRTAALQTLGQVGSEKAQQAIIDATRSGKTEERVAAISGLSNMDDPRASQQLANLMRDADPVVAQQAVHASYNGGPEVDQALIALVNDPGTKPELRATAAGQLRGRGAELDPATDKKVTELAGSRDAYGGYGYGMM